MSVPRGRGGVGGGREGVGGGREGVGGGGGGGEGEGLSAQTKSLVRDEGAEQALVEPLGPNTTNFQSSWPRFTL